MVLGRYELIKPLGQGGMAQVWLARKRLPGGGTKICAVKMVLDLLNDNESQRAALINEIKLSSVLSHSNIVQVFDAGIIGRVVFIEMERIDGVDLRQMLARLRLVAQPFSFELAVLVARECLQGLYYAHTLEMDGRPACVVHRDVSTSNILISSMGEVKIMDFGVGKFEADLTSGGNMLRGKLSYMPPEMPAGINTAKADVFALGAVFYEMVTGEPFRNHATQQEMFAAAVGGIVPELDVPGLPPELLDFYRGCTERDYHRRFDAKAALAQLKKWRVAPADAADLQSLYARHVDGGRHSGYTQAEIALPPGFRELLEAIQAAAVAEQTGEFDGAGAPDSGPRHRAQAGPAKRVGAAAGGRAGGEPGIDAAAEVTRAEIVVPRVHADSEPDAPSVFRRSPTVRPTAPGTTLNLEGPPVAKREAAGAAAAPVVAPPRVAAPAETASVPDPVVDPKARTLQLEGGAPLPMLPPTAVLAMNELLAMVPEATPAGATAAVSEHGRDERAGVGPMSERGAAPLPMHGGGAAVRAGEDQVVESNDAGAFDVRRMLVVAAIAVGLSIAAVAWVLIGGPRSGAEATTPAAKSDSAMAADVRGAESGADVEADANLEDPEAKREPSGPVLQPHVPEPAGLPVLGPGLGSAKGELEPSSIAAAPVAPTPTSVPTPTPGAVPTPAAPTAPAAETPAAVVPAAGALPSAAGVPSATVATPKVTPKKPKPKPVPKVETRLAPNVEADVEIDGKVHALSLSSKDVLLTVGKHSVRWRPKKDTVWRDAAPLKLEAGMRYMLRIGPTSVKVTSSKAVTP
jgi:serine/threonine-protein kinase